MAKQRILTGITTTGTPHLGNYVGAIRPSIAASRDSSIDSFFFMADYHALTTHPKPENLHDNIRKVLSEYLATGLDPEVDVIVEIASLVTDDDLNIVAEGPDLVIHAPEAALAAMDPVVVAMHTFGSPVLLDGLLSARKI